MDEINCYLVYLIKSYLLNFDDKKRLTKALSILLRDSDIAEQLNLAEECTKSEKISKEKFQYALGNINEKTINRKNKGVYYTSGDISKYIIANTILNKYYTKENIHSYNDCISLLKKLPRENNKDLLFELKIIDPTCGTGEFLINTFVTKYELCDKVNDDNLLAITKTIFGNDIDNISILISKIRLFFFVADLLTEKESYIKLANILSGQFYCVDFVSEHYMINDKFDIAVGNPPYVEYSQYFNKSLLNNKFGNIYADVLMNSFDILKENGSFGYIIPLSFISTPRMKKIRDIVIDKTDKQFILNFADRPDCLFCGVHQKLSILIANCGKKCENIYTSKYIYWYKQERENLFENITTIKNNYVQDKFIPKLGNEIEEKIYSKIIALQENNNIVSVQCDNKSKIYVNMRACFWIKAFSFNPGSKEYKEFSFAEKYKHYILCLLNSSLFWFYWIAISDCWHITEKELLSFLVKDTFDSEVFKKLSLQLEKKLEDTKKYIGTKQTEYEYKHKLCKDLIDEIDDEISKVYNLSEEEKEYVKNYALKYRKGEGTND